MNSKQTELLAKIFETPTRSDILWKDVERLFESLGGTVKSGRGSRARISLNNKKGYFHRPHPSRQATEKALEGARDLLLDAGVQP
ncbi:MAG: type II toxin-antitoxin system HicA family toxin, partial [Candidatus Dormibacteraceae bacterium]